jgi:hypothetical protein
LFAQRKKNRAATVEGGKVLPQHDLQTIAEDQQMVRK